MSVARSNNRSCCDCGTVERELRPYGHNGAWICHSCAMGTPEKRARTEREFSKQLDAAGPVAMIDGDETGVRPLVPSDD